MCALSLRIIYTMCALRCTCVCVFQWPTSGGMSHFFLHCLSPHTMLNPSSWVYHCHWHAGLPSTRTQVRFGNKIRVRPLCFISYLFKCSCVERCTITLQWKGFVRTSSSWLMASWSLLNLHVKRVAERIMQLSSERCMNASVCCYVPWFCLPCWRELRRHDFRLFFFVFFCSWHC